jgi:hypothetical protein
MPLTAVPFAVVQVAIRRDATGVMHLGRHEMRTERPTPWGFDIWDPRLEFRRAAADAQRVGDNLPAAKDDHPTQPDDAELPEQREPELVGTARPSSR